MMLPWHAYWPTLGSKTPKKSLTPVINHPKGETNMYQESVIHARFSSAVPELEREGVAGDSGFYRGFEWVYIIERGDEL